MSQPIIIAFFNNAATLLALSVVLNVTDWLPSKYRRIQPYLSGLMIAMICIVIMKMPFTLRPGIVYDTRSILISVTALVFGPIPSTITAVVAAIFRLSMGGAGTLPGLAVIATSALIGLAFRRLVYRKSVKARWLSVLFMSVTVHVVMLACMLLLPYPYRLDIIRQIAPPVMLIYPAASILLSLLLIRQQELKNVQERLQESEERFRTLFDKAPLGYQSLDFDGNFIEVNQQWLDTLGYCRDEVVGKWFGDFLLPSYRDAFRSRFPLFKAQGYIHSEFEMLHKSGRHLFVAFEGKIGYGPDGRFKQTHCILEDITKQRMAEEETGRILSRLRSLLINSPSPIVIFDDAGRLVEVSDAAKRIMGLTSGEGTANEGTYHVPREIVDKALRFSAQSAAGGSAFVESIDAFDREGSKRYFESRLFPISDPNHEEKLFGYLAIDVTERIIAQRALMESEKRYSSYIENSPCAVFVVDENGQYLEANRAASAITGYTRDEIQKMSISDMTAEESNEYAARRFELLQDTGLMSGELKFAHRDGSIRWCTVDAVKLSEDRYLSFSSDITEKKKAEAELLYLSNHDFLTGLYNRRFFEAELRRADSENRLPLSIIVGDINGVKLVNDALGHAEGDRLIVDCAGIIGRCLRQTDILARLGGDEFGVILPETDSMAAKDILMQIKDALDAFDASTPNDRFRHSVSLGLGTKKAMDEEIGLVIRVAEDYMYQRKLLEHDSSHSAIISSIKATMAEKSQETEAHAERLIALTKPIAVGLNLSQYDQDRLELLSTLHDIGKVGISDRILTKQAKLSEDEWIEMKEASRDRISHRAVLSGTFAGCGRHFMPSRAVGWPRIPAGTERRKDTAAIPHFGCGGRL